MKKRHIYLLFTILLSASCEDDCPTCEDYSNAFVIGFDPCTGILDPNGGRVGFLLTTLPKKDTVIAYNFPSGIYDFPPEYFVNYYYDCFFPDSAKEAFPIKIKYRYPKEKEKNYPICLGSILMGAFNQEKQIIILSITDGKE